MTIFDDRLTFGTLDFASSNVAAGLGAEFPNTIDANLVRDLAKGEPLLISARVLTPVTLAVAGYHVISLALVLVPSATINLFTQYAAGDADVIGRLGDYASSDSNGIVATTGFNAGRLDGPTAGGVGANPTGTEFFGYLPPLPAIDIGQRYLGLVALSILASQTIDAGTILARFQMDGQMAKPHAGGFSIV